MNVQEVSLTQCPHCGAQYNAPVKPIINVSEDPSLKDAFLQGQFSVSQCQQCGQPNPINAPVLYHDGDKELALIFVPNQMMMAHAEEQRIIGDLTNRLMNSVPLEKRKAYLFNPKTFMTMDNLIKAVLAADGITEEMIEAQQRKAKVIDNILRTQSEEALKAVLTDNAAEIDETFFEMFTSIAMQAMQSGDQQSGQSLLSLRTLIAGLSGHTETLAEVDKKLGLRMLTADNLLEDLLATDNEEDFNAIVRAGKGLLTYSFFQTLTDQVNAAENAGDSATMEKLRNLRSRILDATARIDEETRQELDQAQKLLTTLMETPDPRQAILDNIEQIDNNFIAILGATIENAMQENQESPEAQALMHLYQLIMETVQQEMPPELTLLNELLSAPSEAEMGQILDANRQAITPEFVQFLALAEKDLQQNGQLEAAQRVKMLQQMVG